MNKKQRRQADNFYLLLAGLFIAALVVTNLIASKFVTVDLGFHEFIISAGILPYPVTFLMTDLLSEFYGRRRTNRVVIVGFVASIFVLGVLQMADQFPAIEQSPVSNKDYQTVFGTSPKVVFSSMIAYLSAQFVDVRLFHFWKSLTKGKHLWLRNNASTVLSQLVDTVLVVGVLFYDSMTVAEMVGLIISGWSFKVLCAAADTPIIYGLVWYVRSRFKLKPGEEFSY